VPTATVARPDLRVAGLRKRTPLWRWRLPAKSFKDHRAVGVLPIRRNALHKPEEIPDSYWILDEKAISSHVKNMDGIVSIPQIETFDENA
jgi:hypothetical protein